MLSTFSGKENNGFNLLRFIKQMLIDVRPIAYRVWNVRNKFKIFLRQYTNLKNLVQNLAEKNVINSDYLPPLRTTIKKFWYNNYVKLKITAGYSPLYETVFKFFVSEIFMRWAIWLGYNSIKAMIFSSFLQLFDAEGSTSYPTEPVTRSRRTRGVADNSFIVEYKVR